MYGKWDKTITLFIILKHHYINLLENGSLKNSVPTDSESVTTLSLMGDSMHSVGNQNPEKLWAPGWTRWPS